MDNLKNFAIILIALVLINQLSAQQLDTVIVDQGLGTLNDAIEEHGGDAAYKLKAGNWYGVDATIQNEFPLHIIGEKTDGMPAILANGTDPNGVPFYNVISALDDLTLKNLFIANKVPSGQIGTNIFSAGSNLTFTLDNCVIDPVGTGWFFVCMGKNTKIRWTNNQFYRHGNQTAFLDGTMITTIRGFGLDSAWIENNTFVSTGISFFQPNPSNEQNYNFLWVNHNTFIHHKSQWQWYMNVNHGMYMQNNLFFDFTTFPIKTPRHFPNFEHDDSYNGTITIDTLTQSLRDSLGIVKSERKAYVNYNLQYTSPEFYELVQWGKENADSIEAYLQPLIFTEDSPDSMTYKPLESPYDSSHVYRMFKDQEPYPNMVYGNTIYDIDPEFNEEKIYALSDSLVEWTYPVAKNYTWGAPAPEPNELTRWHWNIDGWNGVEPSYYPQAWPRFDGSYNNPKIKTASVAGLPLGDLNWFPEAKEKWEANKEKIKEHITSLNESRLELTAVETGNNKSSIFSLEQNYPNPFNPITNIEYSISKPAKIKLTIYNLLGQKVKDLVNRKQNIGKYTVQWNGTDNQGNKVAGGVYFYKIKAKGFEKTRKLLLLK